MAESGIATFIHGVAGNPMQQALIGTLGVLGGTVFLVETGLLGKLAEKFYSEIRDLLRKKGSGVRLGNTFLSDHDRVRHTHIVGSPGSGKTEAQKTLIFEDIKQGRGCFIIDAKGDRELYEEVLGCCKANGREQDLKLLSATYEAESSVWNPCGLGSASELQSKFLNSNIYSEAFYAKACELGLLEAFNRLTQIMPEGFGLPDLVSDLKSQADRQKNNSMEGLFLDFGSLAKSEWAKVLGCDSAFAKGREISLLDIVQKKQILFVHLPTEGRSVQSSRIGRLLTQELILISGLKKSFPALNQKGVFSVYIDEFDAFATDSFITFLNKGRSSNFMIHIAHQTLSDLRKISPEFTGQILGNCNIHLIFRQDDPDDAELWARFIGTRKVIKSTYQAQDGANTGKSSNRETMAFLVAPDGIKTLGVGNCAISVKTTNTHRVTQLPLPESFRNGSISIPASSSYQSRGLLSKKPARSKQGLTRESLGIGPDDANQS